ncbi:MAG: DUF501 domain-containing protein [Fervidobacterium sp.]
MERISDKDLVIVNKQLQRSVNNVLNVIYRCSYGFPVVILSYPIKEGLPFPTIHYLTCPHLAKEVSRLEEKGFIKFYEELIERGENFRKLYREAHEEVIKKRMQLLFENDRVSNWADLLSNVGTGGIRDFTKVKCLHLHVADFLAGIDNPVGRDVLEKIKLHGTLECEDSYCSKL